jgi:hypothetical protein
VPQSHAGGPTGGPRGGPVHLTAGQTSKHGADDDERQALQAEGLDPDDPAVIAAIDLVRWELSLISNG